MNKTFKKYFIPHLENDYQPHFLHTKRVVFYGLFFLMVKVILMAFVLFLPNEAFVLPDVLAEEQRQIVALTNKARVEKGLPALKIVTKLNASAQLKADDMSTKEYFAHTENNQNVVTWLKLAGYDYRAAGENLAVGFSTAEDIVNAWKNSPTHYANLIDTDFIDLGVGVAGGMYNNQPTVFIAQHLASPLLIKQETKLSEKVVVVPKVKNKQITKSQVRESTKVNEKSSVLADKIEIVPVDDEVMTVPVTAAPVIDLEATTPVDKYMKAKSVLSPITSIFKISNNIYFFAICLFILALLLNVFVEIRKQHPHVIFQTSGVIVLLLILWRF
ncbi:MAG: CAP domain-containing protein [Patescibacteria group bacterium]